MKISNEKLIGFLTLTSTFKLISNNESTSTPVSILIHIVSRYVNTTDLMKS